MTKIIWKEMMSSSHQNKIDKHSRDRESYFRPNMNIVVSNDPML